MRAWVINTPAPDVASAATPSDTMIRAAQQQVEAATAAIVTAYGSRGTAFAVRYRGQDFLITSGHVTNNLVQSSTGFDYHGRKLFPIVRGNQFAFAEHLAVNPQGSVCNDKTFINDSFRDLSILRLLTTEQTRTALYDLSFAADSKARLDRALGYYPALKNPLADGQWTKEELETLTQHFRLPSIAIDVPLSSITAQPSYSFGYFDNQPHLVPSMATTNRDNRSAIIVDYRCNAPVIPGHSGSLVFQVSPLGRVEPIAVIAASQLSDLKAYGVHFSRVREGLDAVINGMLVRNVRNLDGVCDINQGQSAWLSPEGMVPSILPRSKPTTAATHGTGNDNLPLHCRQR
jgi:hypothetical protein